MKPVLINGDLWNVYTESPDSPRLVDRTGNIRIGTADPQSKAIYISSAVVPPLLDRVLLHEIAHAITISYGLLAPLRMHVPPELWVLVEEWAVELVEKFGMEAMVLASESLGRPLCINGICM